ncbi:multifunctional CCA tRNA nucleotidyl transferase/2'3'-cyclic phosphodiesterase/2'nucleotidase/phosphatase [Marinobacter sp. F3R08]|uniref:multifunctional CCA tRNA nucleotidyl transferase/2'3'-cyclic phosphodiesterase/2'nucleotidase/phosphatase n=1 Tax=Marinobacter sp. F3R08 TaxID=2841559 RepID=UPI001C08DB11|nr:multifunctional CCA tRNA nucleotidyl transferase/2'3'-cyclic phosphodiesterase/2'nucleotidase/phosphatase [Marinobacter sp. F3R08]MBU2953556.1 multifunctional CCA tRNA nucleotidyl transferase/2'3'-cyclic phosphodiesterase/2'nucleotidase/phosphatase [Marinobacter sp. F3R08]
MQVYLVGGAVRDDLLGLEVKDRDWVVVGATPAEMQANGFKQVGADFPVFLHPHTREEYALARTERKQGRGYHGFTVYSAPDVTLEQDLRRRDLTINAMAKTESGQLVDPFHGLSDLKNRTLRHVSDAFAEDPLRILRTARFAARFRPLEFNVCDQTMALMKTMVDTGEVDHLVPERVWQELQRALHETVPEAFFDVLRDCGALDVLIPEIAPSGTFSMAMDALRRIHKQADATTAEHFSALLSPLGESAAVARAKALKAPNDCQNLAQLVTAFVPQVGNIDPQRPKAETLLDLLDQADVWRRPERFSQLLRVLGCAPTTEPGTLALLRAAAEAATGVAPKDLIAQGYSGKALGSAIRDERRKRIDDTVAHPHD